ncbi:MAG: receptor family ligand binding region [Ramlibacter sp.]|nr:receptor family ligand binding region [Ramlibacter sp.]
MKIRSLLAAIALLASPFLAAQAPAQEVKIGVAQVFEGPSGFYGDAALKGMTVALEMLNERNAFKGKKIVFVTEETQGRPPVATAAIRKLAGQSDILAIVGPTRSVEAIAAAPIANQAQIPMIAQASGGKWPQPPGEWVFKLAMPAYENAALMQAVADRLKPKTMAVMYDLDDEASLSALDDIKAQARRLNIAIVATEAHRGNDVDMAPQISRVRAANPDILYYASKAETGGLIIRTARERGFKAPIVAWPAPGGIEKVAKEAADGVISQSALDPDSPDPVVRDFVTRFAKKYPGVKPDHYHGYGYDAMLLLADAMNRAGATPTRQSLRDAIASTKDLKGVTGTLSWTGSEVTRSTAALVVMQKGAWTTYK